MKRYLIGFLGAILLFVFLAVYQNQKNSEKIILPNYPTKTMSVGSTKITLMVPRTAREKALGLGAVAKLPENYGMLFSGFGQISLWMKGMEYAIDIIWLDEHNEVIHSVKNAEPSSYPAITYTNPFGTAAVAAVELSPGAIDRLGIRDGMRVGLE